MLSLDECKKYLTDDKYKNNEVKEIRETLYQFAEILVKDFIGTQRNKDGNKETIKCE